MFVEKEIENGGQHLRSYPFRLLTAFAATFPKGTAFGGGGKVSCITQRRPLGGAAERSEAEGVSLQKSAPHFQWKCGALHSFIETCRSQLDLAEAEICKVVHALGALGCYGC